VQGIKKYFTAKRLRDIILYGVEGTKIVLYIVHAEILLIVINNIVNSISAIHNNKYTKERTLSARSAAYATARPQLLHFVVPTVHLRVLVVIGLGRTLSRSNISRTTIAIEAADILESVCASVGRSRRSAGRTKDGWI